MIRANAHALARSLPLIAAIAVLSTSSSVEAHFKLLKPGSWLNEDNLGGPQKGGPCGPGGADDVQPVPMSMQVTTVHAGDTIMVAFEETIHHPGWFRIALAEDRDSFADPDFPNADCTVDMSTIPTKPHDNVLMDGIGINNDLAGSTRSFMEMVKIPDTPCDKCTLQVIQVMADVVHQPPGCVYHHCADLKILPASADTAGSGGASSGGTSAAGAGGDDEQAAGAGGASAGSPAQTSAGTGEGTQDAGGEQSVAGAGAATAPPTPGGAATTTPTASASAASTHAAAGGARGSSTDTTTTEAVGAAGSPSTAPTAANRQSSCTIAGPGLRATRCPWNTLVFGLALLLGLGRRRRKKCQTALPGSCS